MVAAIGVVALSHALFLYPTLRPNVGWWGPVVTRFETDRKVLWLTIDDGPTEDTEACLDLFASRGVRATFFVKGVRAAARPDLLQKMLERGHSVANHSRTHPSGSFWCALPGRVEHEIAGCNAVLTELAGETPWWFRAPVGHKNPAVHPALSRHRMRLIGWTARGFDAVVSDPSRVVARIEPHFAPGAIVVLHQGLPHSLAVLDAVISAAQRRGYSFVIPTDAQLR